ncbi:MAG: hypothetical protein KAS92_06110, partial [Candidatus Omnitrophica bacterium]|nr:hypothetical protein [Candidatus Omnitrophota bacterium]
MGYSLEAKREAVRYWKKRFGLSVRKGCELLRMNRSSYHYIKQKEPEENNNSRNSVILPLLLLL